MLKTPRAASSSRSVSSQIKLVEFCSASTHAPLRILRMRGLGIPNGDASVVKIQWGTVRGGG